MSAKRVAILDDCQGVALSSADWSVLADRVDVEVFSDHLDIEDALAERLAEFPIVVAMRERTPFTASLLARLPALELLVTTGNRNAAIDMAACAQHGVMVCGTHGQVQSTAELTWALILACARHLPEEVANVRSGGMDDHRRRRPVRPHVGFVRPGPYWGYGGHCGQGVR